ncbi:hypothetical protein PoB_003900500 [Plakobranchus ocellatus]|uniref:Uncharacterized protein n=1 Tax=Plakobranchus ocellatus TaxID=259542 RepID=A0AAV4AYY0_9GAST|nr:hypothetical protein PoB_003900500 [Plakobranchus ocellatus]
MYRREAVHGRHPTRTVRWVDSIPDSTWEEKKVEDSRRRSRRDDSAEKEVGIEDKSQVKKEMSPCPDERQSVNDNLFWSPLTTRGNHVGAHSFPGLHTGAKMEKAFLCREALVNMGALPAHFPQVLAPRSADSIASIDTLQYPASSFPDVARNHLPYLPSCPQT